MSTEILIFDFAAGLVLSAAEHPAGVAVASAALRGGAETVAGEAPAAPPRPLGAPAA